jgi:hypothetical protein
MSQFLQAAFHSLVKIDPCGSPFTRSTLPACLSELQQTAVRAGSLVVTDHHQ